MSKLIHMQCRDLPGDIEEIGAFPSSAELDHMSVSLSEASEQQCLNLNLPPIPQCWNIPPENTWASISFSVKLLTKPRITLITLYSML